MAAPPLGPRTAMTLDDLALPDRVERATARVVRGSSRSDGARAVVLADFLARPPAERLALRLRAEASAAEVWSADEASVLVSAEAPVLLGPTVVVRAEDHATATALARLFAEIDAGTTRVAPPPRDFWHGPADRKLLGVGLLVVLATCLTVLLVAAALA
ncbi:MAG: hypothetical protein ACKV2O_14065 [Acidimicrobiales bacterium]